MFTTIIGSIVTSGIVTTLIIFLFQHLTKNSINHYFDKKIKQYEHNLNLKSEQAKFDYQRKIQDFNIYTTNKHKSYIELYEQLLKAYTSVTTLTGLIYTPTFEEYNNNDLLKYLQERKIPEGKINEILNLWDKDNDRAKEEILKYNHLRDVSLARNNLLEAQNIYWRAQLYFSEDVINKTKIVIDKLWKIQIYEQNILNPQTRDMYREENSIIKEIGAAREELPNKLDMLIKDMKRELSVGYYKEM